MQDKLVGITNNVVVGGLIEAVCPGIEGDLSAGIAKSIIGFVFEVVFIHSTNIIGAVASNTIGRLYEGIANFFRQKQNRIRTF